MKRIPPKAKPDLFPLIGSRKYPWNQPKGNQPTGEELDPLAPPLPKRRPRRLPDPSPPPGPNQGFSLSEQIDCVTREVHLRENTYPRQIAAGRLTEAEAARKIARMRAVLDTLINLQVFVKSLPPESHS